ncbi:2-nitropropane dioxygenase [Iodidimonas nitroreducens]|uniref:2-nitropropane dioxygenase n=2 Tax=Iodidimonas nitroreducens TaxID=1236968 RepID=A0A5A7NED7_9PROT|nr:nitronate monooxygenase [Iodidimonas nitroreducens]GAK34183.1 putative nitronate monooxygenase [alpha proteobacterium Q-1]GER05306.1 2-nitropropane dioxygenase [Iodidimonas nitroreducens]
MKDLKAEAAEPPQPLEAVEGHRRLTHLMARGCAFLGVERAILGGAMTWLSERHLVSALSNVGGFGVLACGAMTPDLLATEIAATKALTPKPFGVNLITMHHQLDELVAVCIDQDVGHVVLAGGLPPGWAIDRLKIAGIKVICFAPALALAKKLVRSGVDALVVEGSEAGGHIGPVSTSVLAQEILPHINAVPIFVAGGIGRGEAMAAYLEMGAAGVQLGTRFVCATESTAHPKFKQAFIRASARDAVPSVQLDPRFPVIPVRALKNDASRRFMEEQRRVIDCVDKGDLNPKDAQLEIERFWAGALRRAVIEGDVEQGSVMAGQSVGLVRSEQSVQEIMAELMIEAAHYLDRAGSAPSFDG